MRYLYYHYNSEGTLIFEYKDGYRRKRMAYVFYTLREAIQKFRQDNNLRYKHITVIKLY